MTPGALTSSTPLTPPPPSCAVTRTSLNCSGFGGTSSFSYLGAAGPTVLSASSFPINLERDGYVGCAYSPAPLFLNSTAGTPGGSPGPLSFEANFGFSLNPDQTPEGYSRGFTFLLNPTSDACGSYE